MKPKDLVMLTDGAKLFELNSDASIAGGLGDIVVFLGRTDYQPIVRVLHPTHGIREVYSHNLHPMTGGINESR